MREILSHLYLSLTCTFYSYIYHIFDFYNEKVQGSVPHYQQGFDRIFRAMHTISPFPLAAIEVPSHHFRCFGQSVQDEVNISPFVVAINSANKFAT